jgi:imidazolonepropionase-like amidohydrolase
MKQRTILLLLGLLFICCGQRVAQSPAPVTLVKAARLLDPRTGNVLSPAAVLIENAKIKEVGAPTKVQAPSGAKVVDLGSATLLPGLITGHAHLLLDVVLPTEAERARRSGRSQSSTAHFV